MQIYFQSKLKPVTPDNFYRGGMWTAVIVTIFLSGFIFYFLALYHRTLETRDWASITSANSNLYDEKANTKMKLLQKLLKPFWARWKIIRKKMNRKKIFFKKFNAQYSKRKLLFRSHLCHNFHTIISQPENESAKPRALHIFEKLDNSILYTYGMFMNVSLPQVPTVWSIRMFTGWWWLYCILVSVAYKASLTAILANPAPRYVLRVTLLIYQIFTVKPNDCFFLFFISLNRVTIDTLEQLADSDVGCGGWGEQSKEFFITSLDVASQKVGRKFEITYDVDSAVERVAGGEFAYYENVYFLHYLTVKHRDINIINRYNDTEG